MPFSRILPAPSLRHFQEDYVTAPEHRALVLVAALVERLGGDMATLQLLPARATDRRYPSGKRIWQADVDASWELCVESQRGIAPDVNVDTGEVSFPS